MKIANPIHILTRLPENIWDSLNYARWNLGALLTGAEMGPQDFVCITDDEGNPTLVLKSELDDEALSALEFEEAEAFVEQNFPLPFPTAARLGLEMVMAGRLNQGNREGFHSMMSEIVPALDSPQHAIDVALALAGMVSTLADDDDLEHFGQTILHHEVAH